MLEPLVEPSAPYRPILEPRASGNHRNWWFLQAIAQVSGLIPSRLLEFSKANLRMQVERQGTDPLTTVAEKELHRFPIWPVPGQRPREEADIHGAEARSVRAGPRLSVFRFARVRRPHSSEVGTDSPVERAKGGPGCGAIGQCSGNRTCCSQDLVR